MGPAPPPLLDTIQWQWYVLSVSWPTTQTTARLGHHRHPPYGLAGHSWRVCGCFAGRGTSCPRSGAGRNFLDRGGPPRIEGRSIAGSGDSGHERGDGPFRRWRPSPPGPRATRSPRLPAADRSEAASNPSDRSKLMDIGGRAPPRQRVCRPIFKGVIMSFPK